MATRELQKRVGHNIRVVAKDRQLSIRYLADVLGKTEQTLHNKLSAKSGLEVDELGKLAEALDVTPDQLFVEIASHQARPKSACTTESAGQRRRPRRRRTDRLWRPVYAVAA